MKEVSGKVPERISNGRIKTTVEMDRSEKCVNRKGWANMGRMEAFHPAVDGEPLYVNDGDKNAFIIVKICSICVKKRRIFR